MEKESFQRILSDRMNLELNIKKSNEDKYSNSIQGKCDKIIDDLLDHLQNRIQDYNFVFNDMNVNNEIKLYYDEYFHEKKEHRYHATILLIFRNKNSSLPENNIRNYNRCHISSVRKRGFENQYYFSVNIFLFSRVYSKYIEEVHEIDYDEMQESIIKEKLLLSIYNSIELYLTQGDLTH